MAKRWRPSFRWPLLGLDGQSLHMKHVPLCDVTNCKISMWSAVKKEVDQTRHSSTRRRSQPEYFNRDQSSGHTPTAKCTPRTSLLSPTHCACWMMCDTTLAQVLVRYPIHVSCAWVIVCPVFFPHLVLFRVFLFLPLLLPECGCLRSKIFCALRQMRSLAFWQITPLSQVVSPTSSTTTTRSNPATQGPRTCMTRRSVAERSLHHCSLRSEKNQRAVDKLVTLLKKVCCQLSPCLSVMLEQGDLVLISLIR